MLQAWGLCLLAAGIAWSRVYLGLHMPVDVLAGTALGVLSALVAQTLLRRLGLGVLPITQSAGSR
jgi:undecaprenyl-diphosphatase